MTPIEAFKTVIQAAMGELPPYGIARVPERTLRSAKLAFAIVARKSPNLSKRRVKPCCWLGGRLTRYELLRMGRVGEHRFISGRRHRLEEDPRCGCTCHADSRAG